MDWAAVGVVLGLSGLLLWILKEYGIHYAKGMAEYAYFNNTAPSKANHFTQPERCWDSVQTESKELIQALQQLDPKEIALELSDVLHALLKWSLVGALPESVVTHWVCWLAVFMLVPLVTVKLGTRYRSNRCIRNHKNPGNTDHTCMFQGSLRVRPARSHAQ